MNNAYRQAPGSSGIRSSGLALPAVLGCFVIAAFIAVSCGPAQAPPDSAVIDTTGVQIVADNHGLNFSQPESIIESARARILTSDPLGSTARCTLGDSPVFRVGDDETEEAQMFSRVRGMGRLTDGSVAVAERASREIRIFGGHGRFLRSMGGPGDAPGEFRDPFVLWVLPGDTLWVGDYSPYRFVVFTSAGEFVRNVALDPVYVNPSHAGGVLDNGSSVNAWQQRALIRDFSAPDTLVVEMHDRDGHRVKELSRIAGRSFGQTRASEQSNFYFGRIFDSDGWADARERTIALAHTATPEVYLFDETFRLRSIVRWHVPDQRVTAADVRAWRKEYIERQSTAGSTWSEEFDSPLVSRERPAADRFPTFSSIQVGRDGRLWVRPYRRPRAEPTRWMGFSRDGSFLCHLERLPEESSIDIWEFGADYVLGVSVSVNGTDTVVMYALTTPGEA